MRPLRFAVAALALICVGCYLPTDFNAELQIDKRGNYIFRYDGKLTHLGLLRQLAQKEITQTEGIGKVAVIQRDLARDKGFGPGKSIKERAGHIKHLQDASFAVKYKRQGNIDRERSYSFVRFNARMLGISRVPDTPKPGKHWLIKVLGDRPNKELIEALEK